MAEPFEAKAKAYETLAAEQAGKAGASVEAKPQLASAAPAPADPSVLGRAVRALQADPSSAQSKAALAELQEYYSNRSQLRLSAYFKGRVAQLAKDGGGTK
jgi:hypothetical protein